MNEESPASNFWCGAASAIVHSRRLLSRKVPLQEDIDAFLKLSNTTSELVFEELQTLHRWEERRRPIVSNMHASKA
jgi:hypothetical protein